MKRVRKLYFPKRLERKVALEGYADDATGAQVKPLPKKLLPRILLVVFALGLIGYVLTHHEVRIDVEVDLSNWRGETNSSDPAVADTPMNVVAGALMHELMRQGVFPESVNIDKSTISITAHKAPTTGTRLGDMLDNMKDCRVGAFEWAGTSVDVGMLRNTVSCETVFDTCSTSVDAGGQPRLNVSLTADGRTHFSAFQNTMVFVQAAYPIAMIYDYRLENKGTLMIKSSQKTAQTQQRELSRICDIMRNRERLDGVAFKGIVTSRIGLGLPAF